ncbi:beta-ketoacyl-ACP synthase [Paralimibaculum aggregatum]|uniref:Beta-ketoacyl-ACP synthase n=1 Tax=Paralimibaculum aggregatum TaxID=3036245 RepID=A0ABQ6LQE5_9RHOB|nr:beta-ketoacyl-ACP synthase [Limibaculum sp. NKW23]GMG83288.1 beta-ketoacyl-ACP synthase [Limibaculum sp. NKW23]
MSGGAIRGAAITGIGIVSAAGESPEAHLAALRARRGPVPDSETHPPFAFHAAADVDLERRVPKRSDRRQMEHWQLLGVTAAGDALEAAGLLGDVEAMARVELHVAADGGGRDPEADAAVIGALAGMADWGPELNARLQRELKPSSMLAQLPNMLGGNIAIVHGLGGGSRTFMGEETGGMQALAAALARIEAGQSAGLLVGGAYNVAPPDRILALAIGGLLHEGPVVPVFDAGRRGIVPGAMSAFLMLEPAAAAAARGAPVLARLSGLVSSWTGPGGGSDLGPLAAALAGLAAGAAVPLAISAASGMPARSQAELAAIRAACPAAEIVALGDLAGHGMDASFPAAVALAALAVAAGDAPRVLVSGGAHWRGEAAALVEAAA